MRIKGSNKTSPNYVASELRKKDATNKSSALTKKSLVTFGRMKVVKSKKQKKFLSGLIITKKKNQVDPPKLEDINASAEKKLRQLERIEKSLKETEEHKLEYKRLMRDKKALIQKLIPDVQDTRKSKNINIATSTIGESQEKKLK